MQAIKNIRMFNGNQLKLIAAIAMVFDHLGVLIFTDCTLLRIIGRIAFPIFAFMISEGAKYTKNRIRYLLTMSGFAAAIQIFYYFFTGSLDMSVMFTFSVSIALIYVLDLFKSAFFFENARVLKKILTGLLFIAAVALTRVVTKYVHFDYGFYGCMLPVFASLFVMPRNAPNLLKKFDCIPIRVLTLAVGMLLLARASRTLQYWSFLAIPCLLLYSGKRGKMGLKYFFYIFYPAHLVILYGVEMLIDML